MLPDECCRLAQQHPDGDEHILLCSDVISKAVVAWLVSAAVAEAEEHVRVCSTALSRSSSIHADILQIKSCEQCTCSMRRGQFDTVKHVGIGMCGSTHFSNHNSSLKGYVIQAASSIGSALQPRVRELQSDWL